LTLRTLLAYLDDTLEPAQAKLIGQKVAESEVARELIERIKNVTRRRKLAAPPVAGPGAKLDPNTVAEYLDNALNEAQVAEVEETALRSDVHLAEVAAAHQILTLFLGQPAAVPPTAQQRMVGLVKGPEADASRKARPADIEAFPDYVDLSDEADEALLLGMPSYLRRHAWARRLAPVGAILGLIVLLFVALWQLIPHGGSSVARNNDARASSPVEVTTGQETHAAPAEVKAPTQPEKVPVEPTPKPPDPKDKQPIDVAPTNKPNNERRPLGKYVATNVPAPSVLIARSTGKDVWHRIKGDAAVHSSDSLVAMPGYRCELQLDSRIAATLWGNLPELGPGAALESVAVLHVPAAGYDLDCTLDRGILVLANRKPAGKAKARVRFADEEWDVTLNEPQSTVALNLWGEYPGGIPFNKEGKGEAPLAVLDLFGVQGTAEVMIEYHSFALPELGWHRWDNSGPRSRGVQSLPRDVLRFLTDKEPADNANVKAAIQALTELGKLIEDKPVGVALAETRKDAKGPVLVLSIFCLGAIDDLTGLVSCLSDERGEVRWFANQTVRHWIGVRLENDLRLFKTLQKLYTPLQAETIMKLLHGFARDDWDKVETYDWLIGDLESKELAIRELAYYHLWTHVPEAQKIPYNPGGPLGERERGVEQWRKLLDGGKLPPKK
jgi:hypothetical protein